MSGDIAERLCIGQRGLKTCRNLKRESVKHQEKDMELSGDMLGISR